MTGAQILGAIASSLLIALAIWLGVSGASLLAPWSEFLTSENLGDATRGWCLLIGAFWVGATDSWRRSLEPAEMSPTWRYGALAGAAAFILLPLWPNVSLVGQLVTGSLWLIAAFALANSSRQRIITVVVFLLLSFLAVWQQQLGLWLWGLAATYVLSWWFAAQRATHS